QVFGLLGGPVVAQVADRDPGGAELGEAKGDRPPDPARPPGHQDRGPLEAHLLLGRGSSAGAELGTVCHPIRVRGSCPPSSAFEEAWPRRSSRSSFASPW